MRSWLSLVIFVAACGNDVGRQTGGDDGPTPDPDQCASSYLGYDNFGAPFMANWCRGCHSSDVPAGMRQKAPADVNFDTAADVAKHRDRIRIRATGDTPTMPPAGGPTAEERVLLSEWIACGMK